MPDFSLTTVHYLASVLLLFTTRLEFHYSSLLGVNLTTVHALLGFSVTTVHYSGATQVSLCVTTLPFPPPQASPLQCVVQCWLMGDSVSERDRGVGARC